MAAEQEIRRELRDERERLADAVAELRHELGAATDVSGMLRSKLPLAAAAAFGLGFLKAGGIGATARLLARRGRENHERAALGRFRVIDRT